MRSNSFNAIFAAIAIAAASPAVYAAPIGLGQLDGESASPDAPSFVTSEQRRGAPVTSTPAHTDFSPDSVGSDSKARHLAADAKKYGSQMSDLQREKQLLTQQVEIGKLSAQLKELENTTNAKAIEQRIDDAVRASREEAEAEFDAREAGYKITIERLKSTAAGSDSAAGFAAKNIYVTRVYGGGDNLKAQVFYQNNIRDRSIGEEIAPGVVLVAIEPNGITVNDSGTSRFVMLTTESRAYSKTFEPLVSESSATSASEFMQAIPLMPGQGGAGMSPFMTQ